MANNWITEYLTDIVRDAVGGISIERDARVSIMNRARRYRSGNQPKQIRVKPEGTDDNVNVNYTGLIVDRATSLLYGGGVKFDLPGEGESEAQKFIDRSWELNKKDELLVDISDYGATYGTPVFQINPNAIYDDGTAYCEVLALDPRYLTIEADPENYRRVNRYVIEYRIRRDASRDEWVTRVIHIEPVKMSEEVDGIETVTSWTITRYIQDDGGELEPDGAPEDFPYEFPPILPFKNLPMGGTPYGRPDITDDVLDIQDAFNRAKSSEGKTVRLTAFQRLWGKFFGGAEKKALGIDSILNVDNEKAELHALDSGSDFAGMSNYSNGLKEDMFTIARSADPAVLKDKVGQLTNFGVRILYKDAIDKLKTKRLLYAEAFKELNRRLLVIADMDDDPGEIVWGEPLPQNENELVTGYTFDLDNGIASKDTIREKRGYDTEEEKQRLDAEKADEPDPPPLPQEVRMNERQPQQS